MTNQTSPDTWLRRLLLADDQGLPRTLRYSYQLLDWDKHEPYLLIQWHLDLGSVRPLKSALLKTSGLSAMESYFRLLFTWHVMHSILQASRFFAEPIMDDRYTDRNSSQNHPYLYRGFDQLGRICYVDILCGGERRVMVIQICIWIMILSEQ